MGQTARSLSRPLFPLNGTVTNPTVLDFGMRSQLQIVQDLLLVQETHALVSYTQIVFLNLSLKNDIGQ